MVNSGRPRVVIKEQDETAYIPTNVGYVGGTVGVFNWGPVGIPIPIDSEASLASVFQKPDNDTAVYFLSCASYLQYSGALWVVRALTTNKNATADGTGLLIKNKIHYDSSYANGQGAVGIFSARYAGALGNSIKVSMCSANSSAFTAWAYKDQFRTAPSTSEYVSTRGGEDDELHIIVIDEDGLFTGVPGSVLETWDYLSQASDAKDASGVNSYYKDVLNESSRFIYWMDHKTELSEAGDLASGTTFTTEATAYTVSLAGGTDDNAPTVGELQTAYDLFKDKNSYPLKALILCALPNTLTDATTLTNYVTAIAETRIDCIAFVSPYQSAVVDNATPATVVKTFVDTLTSTSYGFLDSAWFRVYDRYNSRYRYIPASGSTAGLQARKTMNTEPFFSFAGIDNGYQFVSSVSWSPTDLEQDILYDARVNNIISRPAKGIYLGGDRTLLAPSRNSLFSAVNVRSLLIYMEEVLGEYAEGYLHKQNDEITRTSFRIATNDFMNTLVARRGILDGFLVSTPISPDPRELLVSISFVPIASINRVTLVFTPRANGGVNVTEQFSSI